MIFRVIVKKKKCVDFDVFPRQSSLTIVPSIQRSRSHSLSVVRIALINGHDYLLKRPPVEAVVPRCHVVKCHVSFLAGKPRKRHLSGERIPNGDAFPGFNLNKLPKRFASVDKSQIEWAHVKKEPKKKKNPHIGLFVIIFLPFFSKFF